MNREDFVVWLDGYLTAINDRPQAKHIKVIRQKMAEATLTTAFIPYMTTTDGTTVDDFTITTSSSLITDSPIASVAKPKKDVPSLTDDQQEMVDKFKDCATLEDLEAAHDKKD